MASSSRLWLLPASISLYALPINPVHLIVMETQVGLRNHQLIHGSLKYLSPSVAVSKH